MIKNFTEWEDNTNEELNEKTNDPKDVQRALREVESLIKVYSLDFARQQKSHDSFLSTALKYTVEILEKINKNENPYAVREILLNKLEQVDFVNETINKRTKTFKKDIMKALKNI